MLQSSLTRMLDCHRTTYTPSQPSFACRQWVPYTAYYQETKSSQMWTFSGSYMRLLALAGFMQSLALHPSTVWQTGGTPYNALQVVCRGVSVSCCSGVSKSWHMVAHFNTSIYVMLFVTAGVMHMPGVYVPVACAGYMQCGQSTGCQSQAGLTLKLSCAKRRTRAERRPELC